MNLKPIKRKILVRKCLAAEPERFDGRVYYRTGNIVVTDVRGTYSHWAEILDVSDDCKLFKREDIGSFVNLPEWKPQSMSRVSRRLENNVPIEDFVVKESLFTEVGGAKPLIARP